uniref:Uncharacterized protein n=1 Tax=Aegilops tauschii TaxID=37682 RepID=M8ART2_AEGTA
MELLLLPSRATVSRRLQPTAPLRRASAATFRPAATPRTVPATTAHKRANTAGSAVLFAAGLLGSQYGFFSSRWDAAETGSVVGWELAARHWNALSMARGSSMEEEDEEDDEEWEWVYEEDEDETDD